MFSLSAPYHLLWPGSSQKVNFSLSRHDSLLSQLNEVPPPHLKLGLVDLAGHSFVQSRVDELCLVAEEKDEDEERLQHMIREGVVVNASFVSFLVSFLP